MNNDILISNLDKYGIMNLLRLSSNPEEVMKRVGDKARELINKLESYEIKGLLNHYSTKNKEAIKRILDKYGIDYPKNESVRASLRKSLLR